jgi:hypothetical protein
MGPFNWWISKLWKPKPYADGTEGNVYYLVNQHALSNTISGHGHGAILVQNPEGGWDYFSFQASMIHIHYPSFDAAIYDDPLHPYTNYIAYNIKPEGLKPIIDEGQKRYSVWTPWYNCAYVAIVELQAGGVNIKPVMIGDVPQDQWTAAQVFWIGPIVVTPITSPWGTYLANRHRGSAFGVWKEPVYLDHEHVWRSSVRSFHDCRDHPGMRP